MTWQTDAACKPHDAALFDAPEGVERRTRDYAARLTRAKRICAGCPVAAQCLLEARRCHDSGIRAGLLLHKGRIDTEHETADVVLPDPPVKDAALRTRYRPVRAQGRSDSQRAWDQRHPNPGGKGRAA